MNHSPIEVPRTPRRPRPNYRNYDQTPRKHKTPSSAALQGLNNRSETVKDVKERVTKRLKLYFAMDDWQAQMIHRIRQGYDSILIAGTGYGKSLIFQGLAALDLRKTVEIRCIVARTRLPHVRDMRDNSA